MKIYKHLLTNKIYGELKGNFYLFENHGKWIPTICVPSSHMKELAFTTWGSLYESLELWIAKDI